MKLHSGCANVEQKGVDFRAQGIGFAPKLAGSARAVEASLTPTILLETSLVPSAACWMLRAISRVAAPRSSTAAAIAVVTSLFSPTYNKNISSTGQH